MTSRKSGRWRTDFHELYRVRHCQGVAGGTKGVMWKLHGAYYVKGIDQAVEIYEVCDGRHSQLHPPAQGHRKRSFPKLAASFALVLLGVLGTVAYVMVEKTEVWLVRFYPEDLRIDAGERVVLGGTKDDDQRLLMTDVSAGRHVLYYDIDADLR